MIKQQLTSILLILAVIIILLAIMKSTANALAWVSIGDYLEKRNTILMPTIVANPEIKWTQADEDKRIALERAKENISVKATHKVSKPAIDPVEVKIDMKGNCTSKVRQDLVNHAYKISGWDMKFIWMISQESRWDIWAIWDWWDALGLCQFNRLYQPHNYKDYKELPTDIAKLELCYSKYKIFKDKGIVHKRFYGYNKWQTGLKKDWIICN